MIPTFAIVRIGRGGRPGVPLWIPLFLVWVLLLPVVLVLAPLAFAACLAGRVNPYRAWRVFWGLVNGVRGMRVEAAGHRHSVTVRIA